MTNKTFEANAVAEKRHKKQYLELLANTEAGTSARLQQPCFEGTVDPGQ